MLINLTSESVNLKTQDKSKTIVENSLKFEIYFPPGVVPKQKSIKLMCDMKGTMFCLQKLYHFNMDFLTNKFMNSV